jgi:hypothetical protein
MHEGLNQDEWDDRMTRMLIQDIVGHHYPVHPFILLIRVQTIMMKIVVIK